MSKYTNTQYITTKNSNAHIYISLLLVSLMHFIIYHRENFDSVMKEKVKKKGRLRAQSL